MQEVDWNKMSSGNEDENERKINDYIARKSRIVTSKEFDGNGKFVIANSSKVKPDEPTKFGTTCVQYIIKELSGFERAINASAISLINGLQARLKERPKGTDVKLLIKKTGTGADTRYIVEHAN
jgi:hypothetical protein